MSLGFRAESTNTSGVITVAGVDQVVINNAGNVAATTFTGALVGNAATATNLATTTGLAPVYGVRAWVAFDGARNTSDVVSYTNTDRKIRGNGNVTNVLRNDIGDYTIFFSTAMPNEFYAVSAVARNTVALPSSTAPSIGISSAASSKLTTSVRIDVVVASGSNFVDSDIVTVMIVG